jgi:Fe-S cluster biogenesis protein NfuA
MRGFPVRFQIQETPNPNALKFILNHDVKRYGKATFHELGECEGIPMAQALMSLPSVVQVHFFENVLSITQDGGLPWEVLEEQVKQTVIECMDDHDLDFEVKKNAGAKAVYTDPELQKIDQILDDTIRPGLQADGGDLTLVSLENLILIIQYEGACGSCPSSTAGTLQAIENVLQEEYNPQIQVRTSDIHFLL